MKKNYFLLFSKNITEINAVENDNIAP